MRQDPTNTGVVGLSDYPSGRLRRGGARLAREPACRAALRARQQYCAARPAACAIMGRTRTFEARNASEYPTLGHPGLRRDGEVGRRRLDCPYCGAITNRHRYLQTTGENRVLAPLGRPSWTRADVGSRLGGANCF